MGSLNTTLPRAPWFCLLIWSRLTNSKSNFSLLNSLHDLGTLRGCLRGSSFPGAASRGSCGSVRRSLSLSFGLLGLSLRQWWWSLARLCLALYSSRRTYMVMRPLSSKRLSSSGLSSCSSSLAMGRARPARAVRVEDDVLQAQHLLQPGLLNSDLLNYRHLLLVLLLLGPARASWGWRGALLDVVVPRQGIAGCEAW